MSSILIVARNTVRQTFRQRLFLNIVIFGVGMVLLGMVVGNITFGHADRVVRSIGLSGVAVALDLMALLVSVGLIYEEIDKKTLFVVLTRPLHRWQYVVGRYLGLVFALTIALLGFIVVFVITLLWVRGTPTTQDFVALGAVLPEAAVLGGFGLVLSSFSTPTLSAGIGLGFWIASASSDDFVNLTKEADAMTQGLARGVYYLLPSLARFNYRELAVYQQPIQLEHVATSIAYGAGYAIFLVAIASVILSRREMV